MTHRPATPQRPGRRGFLAATAGAAMAAVTVTAGCGSDTRTRLATGGASDTDLTAATHLAGLEVVAAQTYEIAADAVKSRLLGTVPFGVNEYIATGIAHHRAHQKAWNQLLTKANRSAVTVPDGTLKPRIDTKLTEVDDLPKALYLMEMLEDTLAQTYLKAIGKLHSERAIRTAAAIQVVDQQHLAIIRYIVGQYPIPNAFQVTDRALVP